MKRRVFIGTVAGALLAAPLEAEAQQPSTTISRIGLLTDLAWEPLREGLRDLGYTEGKNIAFELRRSEGRSERWQDQIVKGVQRALERPELLRRTKRARGRGRTKNRRSPGAPRRRGAK